MKILFMNKSKVSYVSENGGIMGPNNFLPHKVKRRRANVVKINFLKMLMIKKWLILAQKTCIKENLLY